MITTFFPPYNFGGDGIFVRRLANELAQRGHLVDVIHCLDAYKLMGGKKKPSEENHPNVTVHSLQSPLGFLSPLGTQQLGKPVLKGKQIRKILAKGFDVIHYHNISLVGGPQIYQYGQGIKLHTLHEYWLVCPTHVLYRYNREPCAKQDCLRCTLVHKRPPQLWRYANMLKDNLNYVDTLISPSRYSKNIHQQRGIDAPIHHLPNFIPWPEDEAPALDEPSEHTPEEPFFLAVGRLEKIKGLQRIIPIFRRYAKAQLVMAGTGEYEPELRRLAGDSDNIRFLGHQSMAQLQALYRKARALIMPSICHEVFPTVILEAFSQKTPAIVNNLGGMPEIIEDSGGGYVYKNDNELVAALDRLNSDDAHRRELGQRAYEACRRNWTPDVHIERYLDLIARLGKDRTPPPNPKKTQSPMLV